MTTDKSQQPPPLKLAVQYMLVGLGLILVAIIFLTFGLLWTHPEIFQHLATKENLTITLYLAKHFGGALILAAIYWFILSQVLKGKNWARIIYTLKIAMDVFITIKGLTMIVTSISGVTSDRLMSYATIYSIFLVSVFIAIISVILECYGLYILWFRHKNPANVG